MKESFPNCFPSGDFIVIERTAWDLEESAFAPVEPVVHS